MALRLFALFLLACLATATSKPDPRRHQQSTSHGNHTVSPELFAELEELSRIVDISYCVGLTGTGIQKPFKCLSRCDEFESFELIEAWNTGPLLSDSCGYIALSHSPAPRRIILAFRGTYSIANTLADLSTIPQEYIPYPGDDDNEKPPPNGSEVPKCENCTVHMGFYRSWLNTRSEILATLQETVAANPDYKLTLVGHSLGGAVAALAGLDFLARGWRPVVTTFGEPRIGNRALTNYLDERFNLTKGTRGETTSEDDRAMMFRRVTHTDDPVPLLPLEEWGYVMHGGEIHITKLDVPPENADVIHCEGSEDSSCITGGTVANDSREAYPLKVSDPQPQPLPTEDEQLVLKELRKRWGVEDVVPPRYRFWQLFFAHRDYFWRIGLCTPSEWWGEKPKDP